MPSLQKLLHRCEAILGLLCEATRQYPFRGRPTFPTVASEREWGFVDDGVDHRFSRRRRSSVMLPAQKGVSERSHGVLLAQLGCSARDPVTAKCEGRFGLHVAGEPGAELVIMRVRGPYEASETEVKELDAIGRVDDDVSGMDVSVYDIQRVEVVVGADQPSDDFVETTAPIRAARGPEFVSSRGGRDAGKPFHGHERNVRLEHASLETRRARSTEMLEDVGLPLEHRANRFDGPGASDLQGDVGPVGSTGEVDFGVPKYLNQPTDLVSGHQLTSHEARDHAIGEDRVFRHKQ